MRSAANRIRCEIVVGQQNLVRREVSQESRHVRIVLRRGPRGTGLHRIVYRGLCIPIGVTRLTLGQLGDDKRIVGRIRRQTPRHLRRSHSREGRFFESRLQFRERGWGRVIGSRVEGIRPRSAVRQSSPWRSNPRNSRRARPAGPALLDPSSSRGRFHVPVVDQLCVGPTGGAKLLIGHGTCLRRHEVADGDQLHRGRSCPAAGPERVSGEAASRLRFSAALPCWNSSSESYQ